MQCEFVFKLDHSIHIRLSVCLQVCTYRRGYLKVVCDMDLSSTYAHTRGDYPVHVVLCLNYNRNTAMYSYKSLL